MADEITNDTVVTMLEHALALDASDVFLTPGLPTVFKVDGHQVREGECLMPLMVRDYILGIYGVAHRSSTMLDTSIDDDDFSFSLPGQGRFRVNVFHQRGTLAAVIRVIHFELPDPIALKIPSEVLDTAKLTKGLVLVTGPAGSGKSTTLACIIDRINHAREGHIITVEDPLEYIHRHDKCIVTQREVSTDTESYVSALNSALRESPDVILFGEMRSADTIEAAMTAAETGQLLFSTLHTSGAANTVDRIVDVFPAAQQNQVRMQLSQVLEAVVSQKLVPTVDGGVTPAFEIMFTNPAIRNLIREQKSHQIDSALQAGAAMGMRTMDSDLLRLFDQGTISEETALRYCLNEESMAKRLANRRS